MSDKPDKYRFIGDERVEVKPGINYSIIRIILIAIIICGFISLIELIWMAYFEAIPPGVHTSFAAPFLIVAFFIAIPFITLIAVWNKE